MSTAAALRTGIRGARPMLRLLPPPLRSRWRPPFVAVCVAVMLGCLILLLMINIALTRGAYTEHRLELKQTELMEAQQALAEKVAAESAPGVLAQRAHDLGMIPNSTPAFIRLSDGTVLGSPTPAQAATADTAADLSLRTTMSAEQQEQAAELAAQQEANRAATAAAAAAAGVDPAALGDGAVPVGATGFGSTTAAGASQSTTAATGPAQSVTAGDAASTGAAVPPSTAPSGAAPAQDGATGPGAGSGPGGTSGAGGTGAGAVPPSGDGAAAGGR